MEMTKKFEVQVMSKRNDDLNNDKLCMTCNLQLKSGSKFLAEDPESFHMGRKVSRKKGLRGIDCTQYIGVAVNCYCTLNTLLH